MVEITSGGYFDLLVERGERIMRDKGRDPEAGDGALLCQMYAFRVMTGLMPLRRWLGDLRHVALRLWADGANG